MIATAQQINTLLYYLTSKQTPPFKVRFWSNLQKIDFDYSANSVQKLSRFFAVLSKHQVTLAELLVDKNGQAFVVTVAAYIAEYLAKTTGQAIKWYDYTAITKEVAQQNARHLTYLPLSATFECSLTAHIGQSVYCQPLKLLPRLLAGEDVLLPFMAQMTQTLYQQSQVNVLQAPDDVCRDYLAKVKTGRLLDRSIGFFAYLAAVNFDYSRESLAELDQALSAIDQDFSFTRDDYLAFVQDPSRQAFCYLLGFYIGVTSSRLANTPVRWLSYEQMRDSLGANFSECIEHRFILLLEDGYHTPILVVTNRLLKLTKDFPTTAIAFADGLQAQHLTQIAVYSYQSDAIVTEKIPTHWQQAIQAAGTVVASILLRVSQGQPVLPCIYQAKSGDESRAVHPSNIQLLQGADTDAIIDGLYQTLHQNPQVARIGVACFDSQVNLPMGRTDGLVIEVRAYDTPALQLQFILPYQSANDTHSLKIYPLVSHQPIDQGKTNLTSEQIAAFTQYFYQAVINAKLTDKIAFKTVWQAAYINQLDFWALSPKDQLLETQTSQLVDAFEVPLMPLAENQLDANLPAASQFDYHTINWHGVDVAKAILQLPPDAQRYLQVFASDNLIKDELYRQAEATTNLYRNGKVVWGVVIACDDELTRPLTDNERDDPFANHPVSSADIVFDPTGQAAVAALQTAADQLLEAVKTLDAQPNVEVAPDIAFYLLHLQDHKSSVFNLPYPPSVAAVEYRISSSWIWRRHLPNGMLSSKVVPIIIDNSNGGEIMVLPSKLWAKSYYHHWLSLTYQQFAQDYDLLPYINWQQKHAQGVNDVAIQKRLFPKINPSHQATLSTAIPTQLTTALDKTALDMTTPILSQPRQTPIGVSAALPSVETSPSPNPQLNLTNRDNRQQPSLPMATSQTSLSHELTQQLLSDKLRLQSQLSTQNKHKEKKLIAILGSVMLVIIIALIWIKLIR